MVRDVGREKSINVFLKCQSVTDQFPPCSMDSLSLCVSRTSQSLSPGFEGKVQMIFLGRVRQQKLMWGGGSGRGVDGVWGRGSGMRVGAARSVMGRHGEENVGREAAECGVEVTWSVTGQRGKEQVGKEAVDDARGEE